MFKRNRRRFECDFLEERTMLSTAHAQVIAHREAVRAHTAEVRAERAEARADARLAATDQATSGSGTAGTIVGGGLISPGPALSNSQFDLFQQVAIDNNAMMFLTQLETLKGTTANLQQASASVLTDARNLSLLATNVANTLGVPLPLDLQGSVMATVKTAALAASGTGTESAYLTAMASVGATTISQLQMMEATGISSLSTFAATALPIVQTDVAAIATVGGGGANPLTPVTSTPASTTLSSSDLGLMASSYSYNAEEMFLGQFTALVSNTLQVQLYGEKLINDHGMNLIKEGMYAAASGTYLPATLASSDASMATTVLNAGPTSSGGSTSSYDTTYLQNMVSMHEQALTNDENIVNTASNLTLKAFAVSSLPTDLNHLNDAIYLLMQMGGGSSSTTASARVADRLAHKAIREARRMGI